MDSTGLLHPGRQRGCGCDHGNRNPTDHQDRHRRLKQCQPPPREVFGPGAAVLSLRYGVLRLNTSPLFEIALVLVCVDHIASLIVNADQGVMLGFGRLGMNPGYKETMHIQFRFILTIASLAFTLASGLPNEVSADELKEAKVTQVIQDVRVLPSNASPRPAVVNDNVRHGTAVQTGVQSRSELTFKDQTITRLGEKTIFSVGEGARTIDLGSGQFLLYAPKKAGGAKVKMGPVTAAITG
jgi:hypothetical protein